MGVETDESWKGEHLIRGIRPERDERINNGRRAVSATWHKKRRKKGEPTPAATQHSRFFKALYYENRGDP